MKPNILLFSPDVIGHPRVYCRVITDALKNEECNVIIAMGFSDENDLSSCLDLQPLINISNIQIVDLRDYSHSTSSQLTFDELKELQLSFKIDTTVFIEADKSMQLFLDIANNNSLKLHGKNIGIFANTAEWIPGEDSYTGKKLSLIAPTIRTTLGNIKRLMFQRKRSSRYFYEQIIIKKKILDEIWVKDERITKVKAHPVYWMPEFSRPLDDVDNEADNFADEKTELDHFIAANSDLEPVLYFGDAAYYKGYDLFLKFIEQNEDVCAIHAGLSYDNDQHSYFTYDVEIIRTKLKQQGRLFETNKYVHSQRLKELYFSTISIYLTTHRLALSSSTVIQALELGKPVLVPNRGLLNYRIKHNELGFVYKYEDTADLSEKFHSLLASDLTLYKQNAKTFWERFSDKNIQAFLIERLLKNPH